VLVTMALAALVAGVVVAYRESETFRGIVDKAWDILKAVAGWLITVGKDAFEVLADVVSKAWGAIKTATDAVWPPLKAYLEFVWGAWRKLAETVFPIIVTVIEKSWSAVSTVTSTAWDVIKGILVAAFGAIKTAVTTYFDIYPTIIDGAWEAVKTVTETAWGIIKDLIVKPAETAVSAVKDALGKEGLLGWIEGLWGKMKTAVETLAAPFVKAFDGMKKAVEPVIDAVTKLVGAIKDVVGVLGDIKFPKVPDLNPFGGKGNGTTVGPMNTGLLNNVQNIADASLSWGLSGGRGHNQAYREGDPGWHGQNRARDLSGPAPMMMAFAQMLFRTMGPRLLELIYTPMGTGIKNGQPVNIMSFYGPKTAADHYDHVHVAMARGGIAPGGWALVGEQGPELAKLPSGTRVHSNHQTNQMLGGGNVRVVVQDERIRVWVDDVEQIVEQKLRRDSRQAGRGLPGRGGGLSYGAR
jgi:hypothetical protein